MNLEHIKSVAIELVAKDLGFNLSKKGSGRCKFPGHEDKTPSFSINTGRNSFRCFACGVHGSVIDLVAQMLDLNFRSACHWIERTYLGTTRRSSSLKALVKKSTPIQLSELSVQGRSIDSDVYAWFLEQCPLGDSGKTYLGSRGFSEETINSFKIGQLTDSNNVLKMALKIWGRPRLLKCGLINDEGRHLRFVFSNNYLLFPFFKGDDVIYIQARAISPLSRFKWICLKKIPSPIYNENVLNTAAKNITICEGIPDVLSAIELKMTAIGLLGAHAEFHESAVNLLQGKNVYVIGDNDKAGRSFSIRIEGILSAKGITVIKKDLPLDVNDLNDYLIKKRAIT